MKWLAIFLNILLIGIAAYILQDSWPLNGQGIFILGFLFATPIISIWAILIANKEKLPSLDIKSENSDGGD